MAKKLGSSMEDLKKLLRPKPFIQHLLNLASKSMECKGMRKSVSSLISTIRKFRKNMMSEMKELLRLMTSGSSEYVEIQKKSLLVLLKALCLLEALENEDVDDHSGSKDVSARLISVPGGIEEPERRAGETPGTVIPHGTDAHGTDGLERSVQSVMEPKLWQAVDKLDNPGKWKRKPEELNLETDLSNTPSLKKIINNVGSEFPRLLQLQDRNPSLSSKDLKVYCGPLCWSSKKRVDFWSHLSDELLSRADELKELRLRLERTWQLHFGKRNDKILSRADELFERTWQPLFGEKWNDKMVDELLSRVDVLKNSMRTWQLGDFGEKWNDKIVDKLVLRADKLLSRADELKELRLKLERTWQLHFRRERINIIDEKWIKKYGEEWRQYLGKNWFHKIDERWIQKNGRMWIDKIDWGWIKKIKINYRPQYSNGIFVRDLLRFIRNRRHHLDEFQKSQFHGSVKSFYNYFDARFPNLFLVSYGVAYQFCRDEPWFNEYS